MVRNPRKRKNGLLVGFRIRKLRKERNLTQSELAARVGIQQSDLCRMETGEYKVSLETLFKILSVFEMNISEFFQEQVPPVRRTVESEIVELLHRLDDRDREEVREFLRFKVNQAAQTRMTSADEESEAEVLGGETGG